MLGYLTTSFSEHPALRRDSSAAVTPAMKRRLSALGLQSDRGDVSSLYARYQQAAGDSRTSLALEAEGRQKVATLQELGFDIAGDPESGAARVDRIYEHARRALYARLDKSVIRDACGAPIRVRSRAVDRDDYIEHPTAGERLSENDIGALTRAGRRRSQIQIVVSDGLNADAINEQLRALMAPLRRLLIGDGHDVTNTIVVMTNGRVRAGYHVAQILDPEVLIHVIGERPGTGLNTASAYLTYGRDAAGRPRFHPQLDHSCTTAVCGIHRKGKPPESAAAEIARTVQRMVEQRCSGVALR
jgi:ethanolamine ammonia-lyase small subunit